MNLRSHPYESYKPSNSEWVHQIPSEWQEQRVKDIFRLVTDKALIDNDHELLSLYASIGVKPRKDLEARGNKASSTDGYWIVKKGDIIVNKLLAWMGSVGLSEYDGVTSPAYDVLRKTSKLVDVRYFSYLFRTEIAKQIFKRNSRGIMDMRLRLYFDKLGAITVPVPPFSTQRAIATYIDTKTAQIDRKIDLLGQKATQYSKLKQSLINETITRGLDNFIPMKDSRVEWIGEIPAHWEVKRFLDVANLYNGNSLNDDLKEKFSNNLVPCLPYIGTKDIDISTYRANIENGIYIPNSITGYKCAPVNSTLLCIEGASAGKKMTFIPQKVYFVNKLLCIAINSKNNPLYIHYFVRSSQFSSKFNTCLTGLKDNYWGVTGQQIRRFFVLIPPIEEQNKIAEYLDKRNSQIDHIVTTINTQIDKLKELRKALINDVVTGKIRVIN